MTKPKSYQELVAMRRNLIMAEIKRGPLTSAELYAVFANTHPDTIRADLIAMAKMGLAHSKRPAAKTAGRWHPGPPQPVAYKKLVQAKATHPDLYALLCFGKAPKLPDVASRKVTEKMVPSTGYKPVATRYVSSLEWP